MSVLNDLDKLPKLREFDAFPKVLPSYKDRSGSGSVVTLIVALVTFLLVGYETREYLYGEPTYEFAVDQSVGKLFQLNVDITVAMPCHFITVDIRDAVGDRVHIAHEFRKDGTTFATGEAHRIENLMSLQDQSASKMLQQSRRGKYFGKTFNIVPNGPACRVYGFTIVKKVTGNLHITTLGHGYMSWEHTDHRLMNLSHVIHEFSFGAFYPGISQPLDNTMELTDQPFHIFQYFLSVVSTTYISASRRKLLTNQYSVTDMSRPTEHGKGVPGIFFKYDIEPMILTVDEAAPDLLDFLIRLAGIVGGILVCSGYAWRVGNAAGNVVKRAVKGDGMDEVYRSPVKEKKMYL